MLGRLSRIAALSARAHVSVAPDLSNVSPCPACICQLFRPSQLPVVGHSPDLPFSYTWARSYARAASVRKSVPEPIKADREAPENESQEDDKLYRMIELELKGHEDAVLNSYQWFLCQTAKELGIPVSRVFTPLRNYERFSLLKSRFIYKKHFVQYEIRTYHRVIQLKYLTGSTADTYLEYVQRNLPEGVAMKVLKCQIEEFPNHLTPPQNERQHEEVVS